MSDNLTSRVKRIISGSAGALVSALEDAAPEMIMEEAISEVDSAIDDVRLELGRVLAGKHLSSKRLEEENKKNEQLAEQIQLAVKEGKDDLAKSGIEAQLDIEAQIPILESSISEFAEKETELNGYINALQARRREMEAELKSFREVKSSQNIGSTSNPGSPQAKASVQVKVDKAGSAFDRMLSRQAGLPGMRGVSKNAEKLAELEQLSRSNRIEERLARLKSE